MSIRDFYDHQLQKHAFKLLRKYTELSMDIERYMYGIKLYGFIYKKICKIQPLCFICFILNS